MASDVIARSTGRPLEVIQTLLRSKPDTLYTNNMYVDMLNEIDVKLLQSTMSLTRHHLDSELPPLVETYKQKYQLSEFPLTGYMVCNWVVGYLDSRQHLPDLLHTHKAVPVHIMTDALPEVLDILGNAPAQGELWQYAFSTMVIPLLANSN